MPARAFCRLIILLLLLFAPIAPLRAQEGESARFGAEGFTLANGLEVVVIPNHRTAAVTQMVWYKIGGADEPRGKSGIAHFLEHLMFRGTKEVPPGMFSRLIAQNGGQDNAFTSEDYTAYHQTVAVDRLPLAMKLEADRMANLVISDAVVLPERKVILEERRMRIDNNPAALLEEQARAALYLHHPYRIPTIGWEHEMEQLGTADAEAFYRSWYAPNNAILVVSGDITAAQLKPLAEKFYGSIPSRKLPPRRRVAEPQHVAAARLEMRSAQVRQANWTRSYLAPSYTGGETKHAYALQVLSQIMGDGATSRLNRSLVLDQKLALSAGAFYDPGSLDLTSFGFYAAPRPEVPVEKLQDAMQAEIAKLLADGVTEEEVRRAKSRMIAEAVYARDSLGGPANIFGAALATGRKIEDVEDWPNRIAKVTADEVMAAAKFVIHDDLSVTSILLPEPNGSGAPAAAASPITPGPGNTIRHGDIVMPLPGGENPAPGIRP